MNRQTVVEARCVTVADTLVPNYRHGSRAYSCGGYVAKMWQAAYAGAAAVLADPLPADVRRLVIAARVVAWEDEDEATMQELRDASELFADRVEWEDQPDDEPKPAAPPVEGVTSGEGVNPQEYLDFADQMHARLYYPSGATRHDAKPYQIAGRLGMAVKTLAKALAASSKATATASVRECTASPDHADIMETIGNAADDWRAKGYTSALAEVRDMANVGRALMEALPEGYHYMNCPSEIVSDLQNQLSDLKTFGVTDSGTAATIGGERA